MHISDNISYEFVELFPDQFSRPEYYIFFALIMPISVWLHWQIVYVITKFPKQFDKSYYCLLVGLAIFQSIGFVAHSCHVFYFSHFNTLITNCFMLISCSFGFFPCYFCQILQAANRLAAVVAYKTYNRLFSRKRVVILLGGSAVVGAASNISFHIWHNLIYPNRRFEMFDTTASIAWSVTDQVLTYATCCILLTLYGATIITYRYKQKRTKIFTVVVNGGDGGSKECNRGQRNSVIERKLTVHGILLTTLLVAGEMAVIFRPTDPFVWHCILGLNFASDPYIILSLDANLRSRVLQTVSNVIRRSIPFINRSRSRKSIITPVRTPKRNNTSSDQVIKSNKS